jgi:hypothetical protein
MGSSYCKFTAAEDESVAASYAVEPGDPAQGFLCGIKCKDGYVMSRQAVVDKSTHGVEVVVASKTQNAIIGTVQNNPGQYKNQTLQTNGVCGVVEGWRQLQNDGRHKRN